MLGLLEFFKDRVKLLAIYSVFLDDLAYVENRTISSRSISRLSYSSCGSGSAGGPRGCSSCLPGLDDSEAEDDLCRQYPIYQSHPGPCSITSQESLNSSTAPTQVFNMLCMNICFQTPHEIVLTNAIYL